MGVVFHRLVQVEIEAVMQRRGSQHAAVIADELFVPIEDRPRKQAFLHVQQPTEVGLLQRAKPGASWAGAERLVK